MKHVIIVIKLSPQTEYTFIIIIIIMYNVFYLIFYSLEVKFCKLKLKDTLLELNKVLLYVELIKNNIHFNY